MSIENLASVIAAHPLALSPQEPIRWHPEVWVERLGRSDACLTAVTRVMEASDSSNGAHRISREAVRSVVSADDPLLTFIASQVWGYGDRGYGAFRVSKVLGLTMDAPPERFAEVLTKLAAAQHACREHGGVEAYRYLVNEGKIASLGTAFLTKYLHFIPSPAEPAPLVLDAVVRRSIERHARGSLRLSFGRTKYYKDYLTLVDGVVRVLASAHDVRRKSDDVEAALFYLGKVGS